MSKCTYGRWAIINKEGHEFGNLGWFTNSDKADVLAYCKEHDIKIQEGEDVKVVEETEKFEGHLTPLRKVTKVDKIITVQENEDRWIAKKIRKLREGLRKARSDHQDSRVEKAKYDSYLEGLMDAYGLEKVGKLVELSQEDNPRP